MAEHKLESNASSYIMKDSENNYLWNSPTAEYFGWPEQGAIPDDVLALYDTYAISGLPAGPISCPGYAAMEAALNPDEEYINEGYYFFVTGHPGTDVAGQYFYAKTADEHYQTASRPGGRRNSPLALLRGHIPRRGRQELSLTIQIPKRPLPTGRFLRKTEEITMLQQPELLAPAGSLETLKYAVMYAQMPSTAPCRNLACAPHPST